MSNTWTRLIPRNSAMPTWLKFQQEVEKVRTPCYEQPGKFIDYDDPRYPEEATGRRMPTKSEAERMCAPCPLVELCGTYARKQKEDFGVWGGKIFVDGRPL